MASEQCCGTLHTAEKHILIVEEAKPILGICDEFVTLQDCGACSALGTGVKFSYPCTKTAIHCMSNHLKGLFGMCTTPLHLYWPRFES